jgi:hypothetical protein
MKAMKYLTGVILAAALASSAPLHAEDCSGRDCPPPDGTQTTAPAHKLVNPKASQTTATDEARTTGTRVKTAGMSGGGMGGSSSGGMGGSMGGGPTGSATATDEVKPKPPVKKAEKPKKPKSTNADGALTFDGSAPENQQKAKKPASAPVRHSGTVPVTREGGKTCSGQDEYRVCW